MNVAKQRGYVVDDARLQELSKWLLASDESRVFPKADSAMVNSTNKMTATDTMTAKMMGQNQLSQPTIHMLPAVQSMKDSNPLKTA